MNEAISLRPPKPGMALRVGVTGARKFVVKPLIGASPQNEPAPLPKERLVKVHANAFAVLRLMAERVGQFAGDTRARDFYSDEPPLLRMVSPLAVGADRIAATAARAAGFELYAPLPFARAEYERDFPNDSEFADLIKDSKVYELDGDRAQEQESYREVGRFVVRNSDLIVAIWNGEPIQKVGGTSEIVRFALQSRVPVLWIDAYGEADPRLLLSSAQLRDARKGQEITTWQDELGRQLEQILAPPEDPMLRDALRQYLAENASPVGSAHGVARLYNAYQGMLALFTGFWKPPAYPQMAIERPWKNFAELADRLATVYSDHYRNIYVWIAIFAFFALIAPAWAASFPTQEMLATYLGAWALALIFLLYRRSTTQKFHEKWIAYRLLAELCRQQFVLARAGRSIPVSQCEDTARHPHEQEAQAEGEELEPPFEAWVAWYFAAAQRSATFPSGPIAQRNRDALATARDLIAEQRGYHRNRLVRQGTAGRRMTTAARRCFEFTLALVILHLCAEALHLPGWSSLNRYFDLLAGVSSALSAALLGVRAYAEFFLLERQSQMMLRALDETEKRLAPIGAADPLASRDIGRVLYSLMLAMMEDIKGWSQLYGVKHIEPS